MSGCALILVKYLRKNSPNSKGSHNVEIITSLRLTGRDMFFVVHCGPEVLAFTIGQNGAVLMGKWSYDDWTKTKTDG